MKKYTKPNAEIVAFEVEDVITQSGVIVDAAGLTGEDKSMYDVYKANSEAKNTNVSVFTW
ncbi:MAG: hypothetical protein E7417_00405 [Ruminococcaceae bacterium]|nr:hypothetical protein [Oscillospiraceae bacterium]